MSPRDVEDVRTKLDAVGPMKAYRFEGDKLCTAEKFKAIGDAFNDDKERVQLGTIPGPGHSVLTLDFVNEEGHPTKEAFEDIVGYFETRLAG